MYFSGGGIVIDGSPFRTIYFSWLDWIEKGLTSHQTHYRSYQGQVFMGQ